jgi:hypothetical protein
MKVNFVLLLSSLDTKVTPFSHNSKTKFTFMEGTLSSVPFSYYSLVLAFVNCNSAIRLAYSSF